MHRLSPALQAVFDNGIGGDPTLRDFLCLFEFYEYDVLPGPDGFDPNDAVARFAQFEFTWLGLAYQRIVSGITDIPKSAGKTANQCTATFSNADQERYFATWIQDTQIEGMRLVVRVISESASITLADSDVIFTGKCEEPGEVGDTGRITAKAEVGDSSHETPPRIFTADDPEGRLITDPLYEGFPFITIRGFSTVFDSRLPVVGRRITATRPWSSYDDTPIGEPIPMILGRTQAELINIVFIDVGTATRRLDIIGMGPIEGIAHVRTIYPDDVGLYLSQPKDVTLYKGTAGGTGTQIGDSFGFPGYPPFSYTSYITFWFDGSKPDRLDRGHVTVCVVLGLTVPVPNPSGVFNSEAWTDDGALHTRFLLTNSRFFGNDPALIEDPACFETHRYNAEPVFDDSQGETVIIPSPELAVAAAGIRRFRSTGLITPRRINYENYLEGTRPEGEDIGLEGYQGFDPTNPTGQLTAIQRRLARKRFTTNVILKERVKALDFLYDVVMKSYRGYLVWNSKGRIEIRSERPADFAHLRSATVGGATSIPIEDVTPWTAANGMWGRVCLGSPRLTSEVRTPSAAAFTADANSITLSTSASGAVTASASGATLSGGSSSAQASGAITVGGSPAAGNEIIATINGIPVTYTLDEEDDVNTAAAMLATFINAHPQLRRFVSAEWTTANPTVVTIRSKWGALTVPALVNPHGGPLANPTNAPTLGASGSGSSLPAGLYRVSRSYTNANGETYTSPEATITITAGQNVTTDAVTLPAGAAGLRTYVSRQAGGRELGLHTENGGAGLTISGLPLPSSDQPLEYNTTGEEVVRIAMSFASNNQTAEILAQAGLTKGNIVAGTYRFGKLDSGSQFNQIIANHVNAADDFAPSKYDLTDKALKLRMGKLVPKELNLSAVDSVDQARRLTAFEFSKFIDHKSLVTFRGDARGLLLEEMDVIAVSSDEGGHVNALWRVEELTLHISDRSFQATIRRGRQYSTAMFDERVRARQPLVPSVLRYTAVLDTHHVLADLPLLRERDDGPGFYWWPTWDEWGAAGYWRGSGLYADYGNGFTKRAASDVAATVGATLTALGSGSRFGLNASRAVRVQLKHGALVSATDEELARGKNRCVIGSQANGWEVCQFKTAAPVPGAADTYDLTGFFSGLDGTEGEIAGHTSGEDFALIDGAEVFVPIDPQHLNKDFPYKAVTVRQDVAAAAEVSFTWRGNSLKHFAPAILHSRDDAGNILIELAQRSRRFGGIRDYLSVPTADERAVFGLQFPDTARPAARLETRGAEQVFWGENRGTGVWKGGEGSIINVASDGSLSLNAFNKQAWVRSAQALSGDFAFEFTVPPSNELPSWVGLEEYTTSPATPDTSRIRFYFGATYQTTNSVIWLNNKVEGTNITTAAGDRLRIESRGGVVRYYRNYVDSLSVPVKVSAHTPDKLYRIIAFFTGTTLFWRGGAIDKPRVGGDVPSFIYTTDMQTQDFGSVQATGALRVQAWQESSVVGKGFVREEYI